MIETIPSAFLGEQKMGNSESQMFWYAAYTSSRHEKTVAEHLRQREVECFLPLYETVRRWNNGRHRVQLPLFPSYVFVRMGLRDKLRVLQVPGLAQLVSFPELLRHPSFSLEVLLVREEEVRRAWPRPKRGRRRP